MRYNQCMEKPYKLPFHLSQQNTSAITKFNTPVHSTLCSSREKIATPHYLNPKRPFHSRAQSSINFTQHDFLKVKPEPLRQPQEKYLRNSEFVDTNCHKYKSPKPNYFLQGKILHREVDWILYNICNCMVSLWAKNERTLQSLQQHFNPLKEIQLGKTFEPFKEQKMKKIVSMERISERKQFSQKGSEKKINWTKSFHNLDNRNFQSVFNADPIKQEEQVKQVIQLIFSTNSKALKKNEFSFDFFKGQKNQKKQKQQKNKPIYKFLLEQNDPNEAVKKINERNEKLFPILMKFSKKIMMKKQSVLLEKVLNNQKLDDFILDSMSFENKVKMYENMLIQRMQDFKVLKESFIRLTAENDQHIEQNKKIISQLISKGKIKYSKNKNILMKNLRLDQILSVFNAKAMENKHRNPYQQNPNTLETKNLIGNGTNRSLSRGQNNKYSSRQLLLGLNSLNIQIGQKPSNSDEFCSDSKQDSRKTLLKKHRTSLSNFDEIFQLKEQVQKKQRRPFLKSLKQNQNQEDHKRQTQKNNKSHQTANLKFNDKNFKKQSTFKKKVQLTDSPKKYNFFNNKRKGVKFNPLATKQFLKLLHDRNLSKLSQLSSQFAKYQGENKEAKEKSIVYTSENSPIKNQIIQTQKMIKGNNKRQKKKSEKISRRKIERKKTQKANQQNQIVPVPSVSESESKTVSKLRRLKFENHQLSYHKILEKILRSKVKMDTQKNSFVVRDEMVGYLNKFLESGVFEHEGLVEHKQKVQNLIRNYDQRRRNVNISKSFQQKLKNEIDKKCCDYNINVKVRDEDPYIFKRLKEIYLGMNKNLKPSMFQKRLTRKEQQNDELSELSVSKQSQVQNSHGEFDIEFSDFFCPIKTRYVDEDRVDKGEQRIKKDNEEGMLEFMKQLLQNSYLLLGQRGI